MGQIEVGQKEVDQIEVGVFGPILANSLDLNIGYFFFLAR